MSNDTTQPGIQVSEQLWNEFRQDVRDRHGTVRGHLSSELERAIREYINASNGGDTHDRLRRIENRLDEIAEQQPTQSKQESDGGNDSVSKTTEKRMQEIMADIQDRADELGTNRVREDDIEAAIERNAGHSHKTIQRYEKLLQNQRQLFPHPVSDDVYFVKPTSFIAFIEQTDQLGENQREQIVGEFGSEWWVENAPEGLIDDGGRGFQ